MPPPTTSYHDIPEAKTPVVREDTIESDFMRHITGSGKTLTSFNASTLLDEPQSTAA